MKLFLVAVIIWIYCIFSNTYWYIRSKMLYNRFLSGKEMSSYIPAVEEIFKKAGTSYQTYYDQNKGSYNQRSLASIAYLCDRKKYQSEVNKTFLVTIGTFRLRLKHSVFPIHLVFLPSYLFEKNEAHVHSVISFLLTGFYWFIGIIGAYHINSFLNYVYLEYLNSVFERIL